MSLTPEQADVESHRGSHLLVSAVAGSGKTHTMVARCLSLLADGVLASRLLVLMFNASAMDDFERRLREAIELDGRGFGMPTVLTFHGFGLRLCKAMEASGHLPRYSLVSNQYEVQKLARAALSKVNEGIVDESERIPLDPENVEELLELVEYAKNELADFTPEGVPEASAHFLAAMTEFEELRCQARVRTFSDLIYDPVMKIDGNDKICAWAANRYDQIIVDETQDINEAQIHMLSIVAGNRAQVTAVGDDDQCLYDWRGSRPEYMAGLFETRFPGTVRKTLSRTFRYGHEVALAANHLIANNVHRADKISIPGTAAITGIDVLLLPHDADMKVAEAIKEWIDSGRRRSECTVLVREYSQSVLPEVSLLAAGIPYRIVGAPPFFERKDVLAIYGTLVIASGSFQDIADEEKRKAVAAAMVSVPSAYVRSDQVAGFAEMAAKHPDDFLGTVSLLMASLVDQKFAHNQISRRFDMWRALRSNRFLNDASAFIHWLADELDLREFFFKSSGKAETAIARWRMVESLYQMAKARKLTVRQMADYLASISEMYASWTDNDAVLVTSVHRAKGLEWPHVILPGLVEGLFPSYSEIEDATEDLIESERRVFYVGMTRAQEKLTLIGPLDGKLADWSRTGRSGSPDPKQISASRFLYEANLAPCMEIGKLLDAGTAPDSVAAKHSKAPNTTMFRRYLAAIKAQKQPMAA